MCFIKQTAYEVIIALYAVAIWTDFLHTVHVTVISDSALEVLRNRALYVDIYIYILRIYIEETPWLTLALLIYRFTGASDVGEVT